MFDREIVLITDLSPAQVSEALKRKSQQKSVDFQPVAALFEADSIGQDGFKLQLLGDRRNGSRPDMRGTIAAREAGSRVTVLVTFSDPFSVIWSAGLVLAALMALGGIRSLTDLPARLVIFTAIASMLTLYWYVLRRLFETGALTAELSLKDALSARIEASDAQRSDEAILPKRLP